LSGLDYLQVAAPRNVNGDRVPHVIGLH